MKNHIVFALVCFVFVVDGVALYKRKGCAPPPHMPGSRNSARLHQRSHYSRGSVVRYDCIPGYTVRDGSKTLVCSYDLLQNKNVWTGEPLHCVQIECSHPPPPANGKLEASCSNPGCKLTSSCKQGFRLQGSSTRSCLINGRWSGKPPICI